MPFVLPALLEEDIAGAGPDAAARRAWLSDLPETLRRTTERWGLEVGPPFQPGGVTAWVAPATRAGEAVVLKLGWRHPEAEHEPDALRAWAGDGAVRLLDAAVDGDTTAMLLEACVPGTPLSEARPPEEQDEILAGLLRRLWIEPPAGHPFRPLHEICDAWADEFFARGARAGDVPLAQEAMALLRALPRDPVPARLLAVDLHAGNVLAAEREPWLAIDPKPFVGDAAFDVCQHLLDHRRRLRADPIGFADRVAALAEVDAGRVKLWLLARCVQESLDQPDLAQVARALAR